MQRGGLFIIVGLFQDTVNMPHVHINKHHQIIYDKRLQVRLDSRILMRLGHEIHTTVRETSGKLKCMPSAPFMYS